MIVLLADIQLASHDRLDPGLVRRINEMHRAKNVAVIRHGHGRHTEFFHAIDKLLNVASAVEHGVITMKCR